MRSFNTINVVLGQGRKDLSA